MKTILISGSDSLYFTYLQGLLSSLQPQATEHSFDLGLLDGGLTPVQQKWLQDQKIMLKTPTPLPRVTEHRSGHPLHEIQYSKPLLPQIFPGYEIYIWCDADVWFQDIRVLSAMLESLTHCELSIVPEIHRAYAHQYDLSLREDEYHANSRIWGATEALELLQYPVLNSGFFALKASSPIWNAWATLTRHYYKKTDLFFIEQMALNYLVYRSQVPNPYFLPAHCNYIPMLALPLLDEETGLFYEAPGPPLQKIWAMHVTGSFKDRAFDVATLQGGQVRTSLLNPNIATVQKAK